MARRWLSAGWAITALLLAAAPNAHAQGFERLYDEATLRTWQSRYESGIRRNFNTVIRPLLEQSGFGELAAVRIAVPRRVSGAEPLAYFSSSPPPTVTMSATSLKFFDDLTLAVAWLEHKGYGMASAFDYVSMLKYRSAAELGGRYPPPLEALQIPSDAADDSRVRYTAQRIFDSAIAFTLLHELGHLAFGHPGYGPGVSRPQARAHEAQADQFALEMMSRAATDPSGMVFLFMGFAHGLPNRGDFATAGEYEAVVRESTHPVTAERVAAIARWLLSNSHDFVTSDGRNRTDPDEINYIGQRLARIAELMRDPEWQQATAFAGRQTTPGSLTIGRRTGAGDSAAELAALPAFHGTFDGEIGLPDGHVPIRTVLRRTGTQVTGTYYYGLGEGQLTGRIDRDSMDFEWREGGLQGRGRLSSSQGGMTVNGSWGFRNSQTNGGSWNGRRVGK